MLPPESLKQGYPYLQNVRRKLAGRTVARAQLGANILPAPMADIPDAFTRINDSLNPSLNPANPYALVIGAAGKMYVYTNNTVTPVNTQVATGLTTDPLSFVTFRPNASPQPWCYTANNQLGPVALTTKKLLDGSTVSFNSNGMNKVRSGPANTLSDVGGQIYKTGIAEPQLPAVVTGAGSGSQWVIYRYTYRSSLTGAVSNPSPETIPLTLPQVPDSASYVVDGSFASHLTIGGDYEYNLSSGVSTIRTKGGVGVGVLTNYVTSFNWGFSIPSTATINGVQVAMNWAGQYAGTGILVNVGLFDNGLIQGIPKTPGVQNLQFVGGSGTTVVYGSSTDTWGATLTPTLVNDTGFGFGVQIQTASSGGSDRSFMYSFQITVYYTTVNAGVSAPAVSADPQVDLVDIYRMDSGLDNFTYVGTIPNDGTSVFSDTLSDLDIINNPLLEFDNFEPFPSIDLPRKGTCNVIALSEYVNGVGITDPGSGQTNGTYVIASTGGGGTGAQVKIIIQGGVITQAYVVAGGSGYTSSPTFTVAAGGTPGSLAASVAPLAVSPNVTAITGGTNDIFNIRWLPGTTILIETAPGSNQSIAYTLYNRPSDTTHLIAVTTVTDPVTGYITIGFPPAGSGLTWQISEPGLAAEPSPVIWGPTPDNAGAFEFGLDPNNPGDLVWTKGNNFDSAPDTNRLNVTSPSEPLMNGTITSELSTVFSMERFWLIYPNFGDALAEVTGTAGQQWTLIQASATRGLYMRYALAALGSMNVWRAKDCICVSQGGGPEESITDDIYNLFPHEGTNATTPQPVTIGGQVVYPPDDTIPDAQTLTIANGYIYYDYQYTVGGVSTPATLVYDMSAKGWSVDLYNPNVNTHLWEVDTNELLVACADGTIRAFGGTAETGSAIMLTRSENAGDSRAFKRIGDVFFKAIVASSSANNVAVTLYKSRFTVALSGYSPTSLAFNILNPGALLPYIIDFTAGFGNDLDDIGAVLSWPLGSGNILDMWQPDWTPLPENIQDQPSDWDDCGIPGNKFIQGFLLECDTFNVSKSFAIERSDDNTLTAPVESPFTQDGQTIRSFTFNPPLVAHMVRRVSTDGVPWRAGPQMGWTLQWLAQPFPESSTAWIAEASSFGLVGYIHCYQINLAYVASAPITVTATTDEGIFTLTFPAGGSGTQPVKQLMKAPRNKWKMCSFAITSTAPFTLWKELTEVWLKSWGSTAEYQKINPFGGDTTAAAAI